MTAHDRIRLIDPLRKRLRDSRSLFYFGSLVSVGERRGTEKSERRDGDSQDPKDARVVRPACEHAFYRMVVCVLLPRFELAVAAGGRDALAAGPMALAPE